jgi:alanine racemase
MRPVRADINLSAIAANVRAMQAEVGPHCRILAVVKGDGYGLGAAWVAAAALEGGASWLGVACVDEGVELRRAGYSGPILVMSYVPPEEAAAAVHNNLTLVLHAARTAHALERAASDLGLESGSVAVHVKVDTGLGRYGCRPHDFLPLAQELSRLPHLRLQGLMTHFANADNQDLSFAHEQLDLFNRIREEAAAAGISFDIVHAANSAATLALPEARFDMVRLGITLSGYLPAPHFAGKVQLQRAVTLRTQLARVYDACSGESVGYGRTWRAERPSRVGLLPLGYADGYRRILSNRAEVLVRGVRCPVIGRISMDQLSVDLTGVPGASVGDEAMLIGRQGDAEITADEVAAWAGTISYEIFSGLSKRVPRRYFRDGEPVAACDLLGCTPSTAQPGQAKEQGR